MPKSPKAAGSRSAVTVFVFTLLVAAYWFTSQSENINSNAFVGASYEVLSIPMVLLMFLLPIYSLIRWFTLKFDWRSLWLYSGIVGAGTVVYTIG